MKILNFANEVTKTGFDYSVIELCCNLVGVLCLMYSMNSKTTLMKKCSLILLIILVLGGTSFAQGSLLNKIKNKAEDKVVDQMFNEDNNDNNNNNQSSENNSSDNADNSSSSIQNTRGGGLESTTPDVLKNIDDASSAIGSENYSAARFSIKQAIVGVEIEMGEKVLKSLPESVSGLPKVDADDKVTSTGVGFVGLTMERRYTKGDQELHLTIANNSVWLSTVDAYLASGAYGTSDQQQDYKQIQFQGYKGIIEYDESSGYKLSVPFGQSSIFVLEGVNIDTEKDMMAAANSFSIDDIKKQLGEQ